MHTTPPDAPNTRPEHVYVPCRTCNQPPYHNRRLAACRDCGGFGYQYLARTRPRYPGHFAALSRVRASDEGPAADGVVRDAGVSDGGVG